jgi:hypothetical protein
MNKAERHALIERRAFELAHSGEHRSWHSIEAALRFKEDLPEARGVLDSKIIRDLLDQVCERATGKPAYGS